MSTPPLTSPGPPEPADHLFVDDALLDRLGSRSATPADLQDDAVRLLAALAADSDPQPTAVPAQRIAASARRPAAAAFDVVPEAAPPRRRRRAAVAFGTTVALVAGGAGAAAAVSGDPLAGVTALRAAVAEVTGADWLAPEDDTATTPTPCRDERRAAAEPQAAPPAGVVPDGAAPAERAPQVLAEVFARLAAGDVAAAERGLQHAREVLAGLPPAERARWDAELERAAAEVDSAKMDVGRPAPQGPAPAPDPAPAPAPERPAPEKPDNRAPKDTTAPAPADGTHGGGRPDGAGKP